MKFQMIALFALALSASAMASDESLNCATTPDQFGGGTSIHVSQTDPYDAVISVRGGMAHFIEIINPIDVKVEHEADATFYENKEQNVRLSVVTTAIGGTLHTTATFKNGAGRALEMTCN
jgi:hypothetical protein